MRIAVTGATGYVGRSVIGALRADAETEIRALSRTPLTIAGVEVILGDVETPDACRRLVEGVDAVIHAAGLVRSSDDAALERINVKASAQLASLAADAGVRRFVHVSSAGVYGRPGVEVDEDSSPRPGNPYERSKLSSELVVRDALGDRAAIVRPSNVIGPSHPLQPLRRLLARVQRRSIIVYGGGWTNYVAVDDVARVIAAAATSANVPPSVLINAPMPVGAFLAVAGTAVGASARTLRIPWPIDALANAGLRTLGGRFELANRARALMDPTRYVSARGDWLESHDVTPSLQGVLEKMAGEYGLGKRP